MTTEYYCMKIEDLKQRIQELEQRNQELEEAIREMMDEIDKGFSGNAWDTGKYILDKTEEAESSAPELFPGTSEALEKLSIRPEDKE